MTVPRKPFGKPERWEIRKVVETLMQKSQAKLRLATINAGALVGRSAKVWKLFKGGNINSFARSALQK